MTHDSRDKTVADADILNVKEKGYNICSDSHCHRAYDPKTGKIIPELSHIFFVRPVNQSDLCGHCLEEFNKWPKR